MYLLRPASHCHEMVHTLPRSEVITRAKRTASRLGWRLIGEIDSSLTYRVGPSWQSWGETVTMTIRTSTASISSKCRWGTQCFDWGKNRLNCLDIATGVAAQGAPHA